MRMDMPDNPPQANRLGNGIQIFSSLSTSSAVSLFVNEVR
jgi:hypothetical protein